MNWLIIVMLLVVIFGEIALYLTFKDLERKMLGDDEEF